MTIEIKELSNNTPGLVQRYVLREVRLSPIVPVCVKIDGQCNHADTDREYDDGWYDLCNGCGEAVPTEDL